jgi:hypothetical protein
MESVASTIECVLDQVTAVTGGDFCFHGSIIADLGLKVNMVFNVFVQDYLEKYIDSTGNIWYNGSHESHE